MRRMNTETTDHDRAYALHLDSETAIRKAAEIAKLDAEYVARVADLEARTEMARLDLALVKRMAAATYVRKRHALRKLVQLGVFSPEEARAAREFVNKLRHKWLAARSLLRGA